MTENVKQNPKQEEFYFRVLELVSKIPKGKVTTYKTLAIASGKPKSSRMVGWILNKSPLGLPCHRVVNRNGELTGKFAFGNSEMMKKLLESEGIKFDSKERVNLTKHFWNF